MTRKHQPDIAFAAGTSAWENLPLPFVYYPNHYGTFFAFSQDQRSAPYLCSCSRELIENLLLLKKSFPDWPNSNPDREAIFDSWHFPDIIVSASERHRGAGTDVLDFKDKLCHRCNLVAPSLRYCAPMYGTAFVQHFGWYINQNYLRVGIRPMMGKQIGDIQYLPDVCPEELLKLIKKAESAKAKYSEEGERLNQLARGPARDDILDNEVTYWTNVKIEEAGPYIEYRRKAAQESRRVTKKIENTVRQEFGFRNVGEGWVSETLLYQLICRIYPNNLVERHRRPDWLEGLELDIYLPELQLGLEYQGQQHFHPIKAWGGEKALRSLKKRDERKVALCRINDVKLVEVLYSEPLTELHVRAKLARYGVL